MCVDVGPYGQPPMYVQTVGSTWGGLKYWIATYWRGSCEVLLSWGILKCGDPFGDTGVERTSDKPLYLRRYVYEIVVIYYGGRLS